MFLFKFFGFLDFLSSLMLILAPFGLAPFRLLLGSGLYLLLKGYIYRGDLFSTIDMVVGFFAILALVWPIKFFMILFGVYLFLKGFYTMVVSD
jgi:hypothetical protein